MPIRRMIISRDTGLLNEYFSITKGQLIDLCYFAALGKMENDEEETYPVYDNKDGVTLLWVPKEDVVKYKSGIVEVEPY